MSIKKQIMQEFREKFVTEKIDKYTPELKVPVVNGYWHPIEGWLSQALDRLEAEQEQVLKERFKEIFKKYEGDEQLITMYVQGFISEEPPL